jgi:hypothetical protein
MKTKIIIAAIFAATFAFGKTCQAQVYGADAQKTMDSDHDGLSDYDEINIYHTDPNLADTDGDGYLDGDEIAHSYDPNKSGDDKLQKTIRVSIENQELAYSLGAYQIGDFQFPAAWAIPRPKASIPFWPRFR